MTELKRQLLEQDKTYTWYDVRHAPFEIYGLYRGEEELDPTFRRVPRNIAEQTSEWVSILAAEPTGGRIRFSTDARTIAIYVHYTYFDRSNHMSFHGECGLDLYHDDGGTQRYICTLTPNLDISIEKRCEYTTCDTLEGRTPKGMNCYTLYMPLYAGVDDIMIGIPHGAMVEKGAEYRKIAPIVYYGSSITQGGCASRPGMSYQSHICKRLNIDYRNMGFSGACRGEPVMAEYLASLPMSAFVCDYDHNAPNAAHLEQTHYALYETIRAKHKDIPYLMITRPDVIGRAEECAVRREVIYRHYQKAVENGDRNVYFLDGATLFGDVDAGECTVDTCHPNDLGFYRMADVIGKVLAEHITLDNK
ncbi:MAG: hypothetical protein J6I50_06635 [Clostridia bacterium]|nr:hypothetical protein [Clostridia bacterium]